MLLLYQLHLLSVCLGHICYLAGSVCWESGRVKPHKSYLICPQLGLPGGTVVFNTQLSHYQLLTATTCYICQPITQADSVMYIHNL